MSYIDYNSSIYDIAVILLHYYQLSGQLMQQRNAVVLTVTGHLSEGSLSEM